MPLVLPQMKKRTELLRKLKGIFNRSVSQPLRGVIDQINPILRGWVNYFAIGNSSQCFSFIRMWVEKKIRRLLSKARTRSCTAGSFGTEGKVKTRQSTQDSHSGWYESRGKVTSGNANH